MTSKKPNLITFWVSNEEFKKITDNANEQNKSRSAFIRDRAIRPEMTNNELADFLMRWIVSKLAEFDLSTDKKTFQEYELEKLTKPKIVDLELLADTSQMTENQRKKFINSKIKAIKTSTVLLDEIKIRLEQQKLKVEE